MITRNVPPLNPGSSKWYYLLWSQAELGTGVTISSSDWGEIVSGAFVGTVPSGLTEAAVYASGLTTGIKISASTVTEGVLYDLVNQITTSAGETLHETIRIEVSVEGH